MKKAVIVLLLICMCPLFVFSTGSKLIDAIDSNADVETISSLVEISDIDATDYYGWNTLWHELIKGESASSEVVEILVSAGVDTNAGRYYGSYSPLMYALSQCGSDVVLELLKSETLDVNVQDSYGKNALFYELAKKEKASIEIINGLIDKGIDCNVGNFWGYPPLIYAITLCSDEIVMGILRSDTIDVNISDSYGRSALFSELTKNGECSVEVVTLLMEKGANPNAGSYWGYSPVDYAQYNCSNAVFKVLKKYQKNYN